MDSLPSHHGTGPEPEQPQMRPAGPKTINDLPMLVVEYILTHFTHFEVLRLRLISQYWNEIIKGFLEKADRSFALNLANYHIQWVSVKEQIEDFTQSFENEVASSSKKIKSRCIPKMSPRYHHSACVVNESMYIFGGCMSPSTAYNDLWRFDLPSKTWHRIIAGGTLPLPRLFCSFTYYETHDNLNNPKKYIILFGGFLFDEKLDVKDRLLSTIHFFDISNNRWTLISIEDDIILKAGNHSVVIIGDEMIVFNGLRMVDQHEVDSKEVYAFNLKTFKWSRQKTSISSFCPFIRTTMESYRNHSYIRRKMVQTPFVHDSHNILYICGCSSNVLFIAAFLLKRNRCSDQNCLKCKDSSTNTQGESDLLWEWVQVDISKIGLDFEFTYGGEFCKIGDLLAYLTVKNITIPKKKALPSLASLSQSRAQLPREHISYGNKRLLRERRIETLDFYQRHLEMQTQNNSTSFSEPVLHKSTLQLRLLDTSKVLSENRIFKIKKKHEFDYSFSPEAISCYSFVASPDALVLFGGFIIDRQKEVEMVSNKLFMIVSQSEVKLN